MEFGVVWLYSPVILYDLHILEDRKATFWLHYSVGLLLYVIRLLGHGLTVLEFLQ